MIKNSDFHLENPKFKIPAVIADGLNSGLINGKARSTIKSKCSKLGRKVLMWYVLKAESRGGSKIIKKETSRNKVMYKLFFSFYFYFFFF